MVMRHYLGRLTLLVLTAFAVALTFLIPTQAAADDDAERQTLKALRGVGVLVTKLDPEVERDGLAQSTLQTDVEVKLRQAGIRVLTNTEAQSADAGAPYLSLRMGERRNSQGLYAVYLQLELKQFVYLARDPTVRAWAPTWEASGKVGTIGAANLHQVRETIRDLVDEFVNAYLAVNPKN